MSVLQAAVLGLVQGVTEFLPISSKTHLVVVPALLGWPAPSLHFVVLLHLGTLVAVLVYFSRTLVELARGVVARTEAARRLVGHLAIATAPAAAAGIVLERTLRRLLGRPALAALALLGTAAILVAGELAAGTVGRRPRPVRGRMSAPDAVAMGLAQALALLPGISRSGSTIAVGVARGVSRELAAEFSFLMAIVAITGANMFEGPSIFRAGLGRVQVAGLAASAVGGYAAIWWLLRYLRRANLLPFAGYCAVFGTLAWLRLR